MSSAQTKKIRPARINIAMLTYNALDYTKMCIESIRKNTRADFNIFVLDNGSKDETRPWLATQTFPNFFYEYSEKNSGVPGGRNQLIEIITPHLPEDGFIVFLDNDMELLPGWDDVYLSFFEDHPEAGIASAFGHRMIIRQYYRELLPPPPYTAPVDVACGGFCCWIRAAAVKAVKTFDENLGLFWHEDDDFSIRTIGAGFDVYSLPHAPVIHHEHKSGAANPGIKAGGSPKNQVYLCEKWRKLGLVDSEGRVIRPFTTPKVAAAQLASVKMGNYRWIGKEAAFRLDSQNSGEKLVSFTLACAKREFYPSFPFSVEVSTESSPAQRLTFSMSEDRHEVSIALKPGEQLTIKSEQEFVPAFVGLGVHWRGTASLQAALPPELVPVELKSTDTKNISWHSSALDTDCYSEITDALLPGFAEHMPSLGFTCSSLNEWVLSETQKDAPYLGLLKAKGASISSASTFIVAHDPLRSNGQNYYAELRKELPKDARLFALTVPPFALSASWITAAGSADELWVLTEAERRRVIEAGVPAEKVRVCPLGVDSSVFSPLPQGEKRQLVPERFCFLARVHSVDDPFLRTIVSAYVRAFTSADPVCLVVTIPPTGGMLPVDYIQGIAGDTSLNPETCPPVVTLNYAVPAELRSRIFQAADAFIAAPHPQHRFDVLQALATGLPVAVANPHAGSCEVLRGHHSHTDLLSNPVLSGASTSQATLEQCLHPQFVMSCGNLLRDLWSKADTYRQDARASAEQISSRFPLNTTLSWIEQRISQQPTVIQAPQQLKETVIREIPSVTIGIDARTLTYSENIHRGIGHYTCNHLSEIFRLTPSWQYILYRDEGEDSEALTQLASFPNVRLGVMGEQHKDELDLYHIADPMTILQTFDSPFLLAPNVPLSGVFYDLIPLVKKDMHFDRWEPWRQKAYRRRINELLRSQAEFFAISESTRQDLHKFTGYPLDHITSIMAGINRAENVEIPSPQAIQAIRNKFKLHKPFFMSVGGLDGHKGFLATAKAYASVVGELDIQFAVVGSLNDPYKEQFRQIFEANKIPGVVFTGYLSREEMACLYAASSGLVFPSHYEGFGFPVLEAMAHSCPVITTNVSSLPEVAGDACILVPVEDDAAIAEAMRRLIREPSLRTLMVEKGLAQAATFSWNKSARLTISVWTQQLGVHSQENGVSSSTQNTERLSQHFQFT